ncbi:MAG: SAM-dependent chlorinase/fluorinase, partial [Actinomycetota bacterium]|nr:SAM-dependent chlorinase/fluorinase [Actinomycetota bacterium]
RENLCIVTKGGTRLVGPDNGVLIPAARRGGGIADVFGIEPAKLDFRTPLPTFHARDVLAPAAAALACGVDPGVLGVRLDEATLMPAPFGPCTREGAVISAEVVDVDRFGSVRIAITSDDLDESGVNDGFIDLSFGHLSLDVPFGLTFSDVADGDPVALIDSSGWLTLAVRTGSAAERYGIEPGSVARVRIHP